TADAATGVERKMIIIIIIMFLNALSSSSASPAASCFSVFHGFPFYAGFKISCYAGFKFVLWMMYRGSLNRKSNHTDIIAKSK
ncbi:MAG: hypothetical protein ACKPKO_35435, partial [Candidatus Fonsibacter sp.]